MNKNPFLLHLAMLIDWTHIRDWHRSVVAITTSACMGVLCLNADDGITPVSAWSIATMRIPKLHIEAATLSDACQQIKKCAAQSYPELPPLSFKFIDVQETAEVKNLRLNLENVLLYDALRYCSELALCSFEPSGEHFVFRKPAGLPSVNRIYFFNEAVLRHLNASPEKAGISVNAIDMLSSKFGLHSLKVQKLGHGILGITCVAPPAAHAELERALLHYASPSPYLIRLPDGSGVRSR